MSALLFPLLPILWIDLRPLFFVFEPPCRTEKHLRHANDRPHLLAPHLAPPLMVRGGVERGETEGIRKFVFDGVEWK